MGTETGAAGQLIPHPSVESEPEGGAPPRVSLPERRARSGREVGVRRLERSGKGFPGAIALLFIGLYCVKRFGMELLREEHPLVLGSLSWAHAASLAGLVTVVVMAGALARRRRTDRPSE